MASQRDIIQLGPPIPATPIEGSGPGALVVDTRTNAPALTQAPVTDVTAIVTSPPAKPPISGTMLLLLAAGIYFAFEGN